MSKKPVKQVTAEDLARVVGGSASNGRIIIEEPGIEANGAKTGPARVEMGGDQQ